MAPANTAMNFINRVTSKPVSAFVKKLEAIRERKSGDSPKRAMLVPDAIPV